MTVDELRERLRVDERPGDALSEPVARPSESDHVTQDIRPVGAHSPRWERRYGLKLLATDFAIVFATVYGAQALRFGFLEMYLHVDLYEGVSFDVSYPVLSFVIAVVWLFVLAVSGARDPKVFGVGPVEYKRVLNSTLLTVGIFAVLSYAMRAEIPRGYMLIAFPLGLGLLLISRWLWRKRLHRMRSRGRNTYRTLVMGDRAKSEHVARELGRSTVAGFEVVGAVTERGTHEDLMPGVPVVAGYDDLLRTVDLLEIDTLIMTSQDSIDPQRIRQIGWELEARDVSLVVAAALTDIAGQRIHTRPVNGLPLIHVEHPQFVGRKYWAKRTFDVVGSVLLIALLSPLLLFIALMVKLTSPGPVLFSHKRIGQNGKPFKMLKFRSMVNNAESQLKSLLDAQGTSGTPLFKVTDDPRITPFGKFIRKYSLDELPQLFNALTGSMSLVGPRPQIAEEVALYDDASSRRLMVKPGLTGPWQVSGRSDLSWDDTVRLDLIQVRATGPTPEAARDLASAWVRGMQVEIEGIETADGNGEAQIRLEAADSARLPTAPTSPNTRLALAVGALLGIAAGIGYAFLRYTLDRRIRNPEVVEKETGLTIVGTIPDEKSFSETNRLIPTSGSRNAAGDRHGLHAIAEAMRELRTNIQFMDVDNPPKSIVVTSSLPGEGKSTTSSNLAITLAASGNRVILIDGDLRRPMVATVFGIPGEVGLTDVLAGRAEIADVAHPVGRQRNLLVVAAGKIPPNPSELLGSRRMRELVERLTEEAFVIIDAPPLIPVTDAAVLSHNTDGALLVTSVGKTTIEALLKAQSNLERAGARALGVVLNRVPRKGSGSAYYGYQYTGDYYRSEDETAEGAAASPFPPVGVSSDSGTTPRRRARR